MSGDTDRWASLKESLLTFHRAPCLGSSLGSGVVGGVGLGALRYYGARDLRAAGTWGAVAGGLLCASNWYVCRRTMYRSVHEETALLQEIVDAVGSADDERRLAAMKKLEAYRAAREHAGSSDAPK